MTKLFKFIMRSSADPMKTSRSVKGALMLTIPFVLQALDLVCGIGQYCFDVNNGALEELFESVAQLVYFITLAVGAIMSAYGIGRKVIRTISGQNLAIKD